MAWQQGRSKQMRAEALRKRLNADNLLTSTVLFEEAFRAYPWLILLSGLSIRGWSQPPFSFLSALVIMAVVTLTLSFCISRKFPLAETRIATISVGVISIILLTRLENGGGYAPWDIGWFDFASTIAVQLGASFLFGMFLVWRGITVAREELRTDYLYRNFMFGVASFIVLMVVWAASSGIQASHRVFTIVVPYVIGYFFMGLLGLGVSNFLSLRKGVGGKSKATDLFSRRWLLILLGVVTTVVLAGSLVASGISLNLVSLILNPLNVAAGWLAVAFLYVVGYPIGYFVEGLGWIIGIIINWIRSLSGAKPFESPEFSDFANNADKLRTGQVPEGIFNLVKWGLFLIAAGLVIYLLSRAIYRYWRGNEERGYEEINESLWSWNNFRGDLRGFLDGLTNRFHRKPHVPPPLASTITDIQPLDIREVYRGLLWEGAACGHPKFHAHTPNEYKITVQNVVPTEKESIQAITEAYIKDRYGNMPISEEQSLSLVREWLKLRSALRGTLAGLEKRQAP